MTINENMIINVKKLICIEINEDELTTIPAQKIMKRKKKNIKTVNVNIIKDNKIFIKNELPYFIISMYGKACDRVIISVLLAIPAPIMRQDGQNEERECHLNERTCARGGKINWHRAKRVRI